MSLRVLILAAGQGTRMRSDLPKVLHPLAGRSLLEHVHATALALGGTGVRIVYGHGGELLRERLAHLQVEWVLQSERLGTGHAVQQAMPGIGEDEQVLVLYGDVPLIAAATLERLVAAGQASGFSLLTVELEDPTGYGRIVRTPDGAVARIVEHKDASDAERALREVNTGIMMVRGGDLRRWLDALDNDNAQGEYYLTDIVAMAVAEGVRVATVAAPSAAEVMGVNDRLQLARLERLYQRDRAEALMRDGLSLADPERFDLRGSLQAGRDVWLDIDVLIEGRVELGDRVRIGPGVCLRDCVLGDDVEVLAYSVLEAAEVGAGARIGPFARLRPGTQLSAGVHIGNFVEVKNARIGTGSKVNHLSYVGDAEVGQRTNIGAGTITCNYDGANKHLTRIGDDVFIGSDTQLVAPVQVGDGATLGAGTTLTRDAPPGELTLSRAPQRSLDGWKRPRKKP